MAKFNKEDINSLIDQFVSTKLPPILDFFKSSELLLKDMRDNKIPIYGFTGNVIQVDTKKVKIPTYIFHKGSEAIRYFSFKNNLSLRPMGIGNPIWYFAFVYNILVAGDSWLKEIYNKKTYKSVILHSNSPILGKNRSFSIDYVDGEIRGMKYVGIINEMNNKTSQSFKKNQEKTEYIEGTKPLYLKTDIENYFENIYTHQLSKLSDRHPYKDVNKNSDDILHFFAFLDEYNMGINDNHTKGILQGPLSSTISAEFLGLYLDFQINQQPPEKYYIRYVDDMTFFSFKTSVLENQIDNIDRILRPVGLSRKIEKTEIGRGFAPQKQADLTEIFISFPFLDKLKSKNEKKLINRSEILGIRAYIEKLIKKGNIPQIRATFTMIDKYLKKVKFANYTNHSQIDVVVFLTPFLLKVSYSFPIVCVSCYQILETLLQEVPKALRKNIIETLKSDIEYIDDRFAETELQIWHYYLLGKYSYADERRKILNNLIKNMKKDHQSTDPLLLIPFIHRDSSSNLKIYELVKKEYMESCGFDSNTTNLQGISSSCWWPVMVKLFIYFTKNQKKGKSKDKRFNNVRKKVIDLFLQRGTNKPNYEELGIFVRLLN